MEVVEDTTLREYYKNQLRPTVNTIFNINFSLYGTYHEFDADDKDDIKQQVKQEVLNTLEGSNPDFFNEIRGYPYLDDIIDELIDHLIYLKLRKRRMRQDTDPYKYNRTESYDPDEINAGKIYRNRMVNRSHTRRRVNRSHTRRRVNRGRTRRR